jgi:hypothetical protein
VTTPAPQTSADLAPPTQQPPPRAIPTSAPQKITPCALLLSLVFVFLLNVLNLHAEVSISSLPKTYKTALLEPNWATAMQDEYIALIENNSWELVPRPSHTTIVSGKWIFRYLNLMVLSIVAKLVGSVVVILNNTVLITMKPSSL